MIRPGKDSKDQDFALSNKCAVIGWHWVGDLRDYKGDIEAIKNCILKGEPGSKSIATDAKKLLNFVKGVKKGDLIIVPLKGGVRNQHSAIGEVILPYRFRKKAPLGCKHQRPVKWLKEEFPNSKADILVAVAQRRPALNRVGGDEEHANLLRAVDEKGEQSLGSVASDQGIKRAIGRKFPAKQMEELVRHILDAMGYECEKPKSKGADGGLDAFATHPDKNGLVDPICAQVKNTTGAVGAPEMQKLAGAMSEACMRKGCMGPFYKGLFISYGGFGGTAKKKELAQRFPRIRQWDADDILRLAREYCGKIKCANCKKRLAECGISAAGSVQ